MYGLDQFDKIYTYNKAEERNALPYVFLTSFLSRATKKGFDYEILEDRDNTNNVKGNTEHRMTVNIEELLWAPDIDHEAAEALQMKTNKVEDTKDDKITLDRYFIKLRLGVEKLDDKILEHFHYKYHRMLYDLGLMMIKIYQRLKIINIKNSNLKSQSSNN